MNQSPNQNQNSQSTQNNLGIQIREDRMYKGMKEETMGFISNIFINFSEEQLKNHDNIAKNIKVHMDKLYGPPWHCIVGKVFGSAVTYKNKNFLYLYISNKAIMIFRH